MSYRDIQPCDCDDLRTLFLFESLDDDQLAYLCDTAHLEVREPGPVVTEGDAADALMVLMGGEIVVSKRAGERDIEVNRTSHRGTFFGAVAPFLDSPPQTSLFSVRAVTRCQFAVIDGQVFGQFVRTHFPMAVHLLQGMWGDNEGMHLTVDQQHRIRAAGTIAAGLAHGLNNPAAATVRAAADLHTRVARLAYTTQPGDPCRIALEPIVAKLETQIRQRYSTPGVPSRSTLMTSESEDAVADWLAIHGVSEPWDMAATLVEAGVTDIAMLEVIEAEVAAVAGPDTLERVLGWLAAVLGAELGIADIVEAGGRISELVDASKHYSHLDGAVFDVIDLHKLLDSTVDVLAPALGRDIEVVRRFDPKLVGVACYPGELSQALTHLVRNAIDAMRAGPAPGRTLTLATEMRADAIVIEIGDTGAGVDPAIRDCIFDPFFSTKPVGQGSGLGLNAAWRIIADRHGGTLSVHSVPGDTRFTVRLQPVHAEAC